MQVEYKEVESINEFIDAIRLRADIFIIEQGFKPGWEPDEDDKVSKHYISIVDNEIVGAARFREVSSSEFKIERMVTKKELRSKHIGTGLIEFMITDIKKLKPKRIWVRSQVRSQFFYEKVNFTAISKPYDLWGVQHIDMDYNKK
jgi:predicted GNAT family N-acyltransferase